LRPQHKRPAKAPPPSPTAGIVWFVPCGDHQPAPPNPLPGQSPPAGNNPRHTVNAGNPAPVGNARAGFHLLAPHYRWMEAVLAGRALQRCRTAFLDHHAPRHALLVGEGNGRFLEALPTRHPTTRITVVDSCRAMLETAEKRISRRGIETSRIDWIEAVIPEWQPPPAAFDMVVANFFLDCFDEDTLPAVARTLAAASAPRARLLVADFATPPRGPARWRARILLATMYAFFRATTRIRASRLVDPEDALRGAGFTPVARRGFQAGFLVASLWRHDPADKRQGIAGPAMGLP
jgi:ubiquinone/menaquinone biosynthesis C-methylase UbiE